MRKQSLSLRQMQKKAHANSKAKGFHAKREPRKWALPTRLALIHSEVSEALEDFRNGYGPNEIYFESKNGKKKPCGIPIEIADIVIRCGDFCDTYGIDLEKAVQMKMDYNGTRPKKHGGKVV